MIQRKLPTQQVNSQQGTAQHLMMTTRQVWPAQHTIRTRQWTAQQWLMDQWPMVLQQGTRQLQDKTHPCCWTSAVFRSHHCREGSTRLLWLISCPCGLWCSVGWTRVWLFFMPRPGLLHSQPFLRPEIMTPHPGGPRLHLGRQTDDPGRQWDGPGHLWEEPEGLTTLKSPHLPVRPSEGLRRLIHLEISPRDASPVNFSAALDSEDRVKDRSITDDEDEDGAQKVSAAQYQLFRQVVTISKGSFKVNPAKSCRGSRASLLDLGDSEVTDRVSWLDQPSLKDTMASTARIAQGLNEDEEVEKTTLSETLNTSSSPFKHLTVKQIFPREPYRLKVHRDAQYVPKPPGDSGFSDSKAFLLPDVPSYVPWYGGVGQEVSDLWNTRRLHGGICHRGTISQGREDEAAEGEVSHYPGSPCLSGVSRLCVHFQSSAVVPWRRLVEELWVPASGPVYSENCTVQGLPCARSRAQGPSEPSENHQAGRQDGWVISHIRPEALWGLVQHKSDVVKEDCF